MIVVDGMGGHAHGARAAEVTVATLKEAFAEMARPVFDPQGFLTLSLARAHERVVKLGEASRSITSRARRAPYASSRMAVPIGRTSATAASISCAAARSRRARATTAMSSSCCAKG